jgi:hypothetical protein
MGPALFQVEVLGVLDLRFKLNPNDQAVLSQSKAVNAVCEAYLKGRYFWNKRTGEVWSAKTPSGA